MTALSVNNNFQLNILKDGRVSKKKKKRIMIHESSDESDIEDVQNLDVSLSTKKICDSEELKIQADKDIKNLSDLKRVIGRSSDSEISDVEISNQNRKSGIPENVTSDHHSSEVSSKSPSNCVKRVCDSSSDSDSDEDLPLSSCRRKKATTMHAGEISKNEKRDSEISSSAKRVFDSSSDSDSDSSIEDMPVSSKKRKPTRTKKVTSDHSTAANSNQDVDKDVSKALKRVIEDSSSDSLSDSSDEDMSVSNKKRRPTLTKKVTSDHTFAASSSQDVDRDASKALKQVIEDSSSDSLGDSSDEDMSVSNKKRRPTLTKKVTSDHTFAASSSQDVDKDASKALKRVIEDSSSDSLSDSSDEDVPLTSRNDKASTVDKASSCSSDADSSSDDDINVSPVRIFRKKSDSDKKKSSDDDVPSSSQKEERLPPHDSDSERSDVGPNNDSSSSDSSSEEDDNAPPIRIFRKKNAGTIKPRGYDSGNEMSEKEDSDSEIPNHMIEYVAQVPRKAKKQALAKAMEIRSETQRLIREARVNLPYHVPEPKKLSEFLKRPLGFQQKPDSTKKTTEEKKELEKTDEKMDSGLGLPDLNSDESSGDKDIETLTSTCAQTPLDRKSQLLALSGVDKPSLALATVGRATNVSTQNLINLDEDEEPPKPDQELTNFMERFFKNSKFESSASKKKVQFNIIKKEERSDGSGVDLVSEVVTHTNTDEEKNDTSTTFKSLREKLRAKMKERRSIERLKRQELYKLDNEEIGSDNNEEEEEEDFTDEGDSSGSEEEEVKQDVEVDSKKNHVIDDDDDDIEEPTQLAIPEISNSSSLSRTSQHTEKSDILSTHLSREESLVSLPLFDESTKKSSCSREESLHLPDQSLDPFDSSTIPPNKMQNSGDSNLKPARMNCDEDSYFGSSRSFNLSNQSPTRQDYESQFFDSDGFIKESSQVKSLNSLLPPGGEDDNANDYNMSQLLELCSGKFQEVSSISPHTSAIDGPSDTDGKFIDESFGFQVEEDTKKEENFQDFSDKEDSDEDNDEDAGITIIRKKKDVSGRMAKNFLEEEAELSGDDVESEDEEDDIGGNHYESDENDELLPKEEVIQQQVNKVHLKQLLDEDQRDIDLLQEAFVTAPVEVRRNRKFRWNNIDENITPTFYQSDDENEDPAENDDEVEMMGSEESQWRIHRLKREEFINSNSESKTTENEECLIEEDSQLLRMGKNAVRKSRVFSEINEDSRTNSATKLPSLTRSTSLTTTKLPSRNSFLSRKPEVLSKFANFKEASIIKGAVNSDRMVFKAVSPSKKLKKAKRPSVTKKLEIKRPRLDEDSNSIFNLFEM